MQLLTPETHLYLKVAEDHDLGLNSGKNNLSHKLGSD